MAESNYLASHLSDPKYQYDLVLGTTAEAINATMKMYLYKDPSPPVEVWYQQETVGGPVTPMNPIPGVDPFSVPTDGTVPDAILQSNFVFAIKAGFGLPSGVSPLDLPDIVSLTGDSQTVGYNLFFADFDIVTLEWGRHGTHAWKNYQQPSGSPFIFKFSVDMNLDPADPHAPFSNLPPDVQRQLQNYNTSTAFSVQQLYLDLNNAGLQRMPIITGIPSNSPVYNTIQSNFVNTYWNQIAEQGKFILGYAVHGHSNPSSRASLQPTSLNFKSNPHYDASGNPTTSTQLYTLNYLMNTNVSRPLTVGAAFPWNWVTTDEASSFHGAMSVRREIFANYLNNSISTQLGNICIKPYSHINLSSAGFKWSASWNISPDNGQSFTYQPAGNAEILKLNYSSSSNSHDKSGLISGHFNMSSTSTGSVSVEGNAITIALDSTVTMDFDNGDLGTATVKGRVGGYSATAKLLVSVDASGAVSVTEADGYPKVTDKGADIDSGFMAGLDKTVNVGNSLKSMYSNMTSYMQSIPGHIETYLNSTGGKWIFPGGQTLVFKDAAFSTYQDFVAHVTYADPA